MTKTSESPARQRTWRILFGATVIHFLVLGLLASHDIRQGFDDPSILRAFHPDLFGVGSAVALWLFLNSNWVMLALLAADVPALVLLWKLGQNRPSRKLAVGYLAAVLGLAVVHAMAIVHAARVGVFQTANTTYEVSGVIPAMMLQVDLLLTLPAWAILAAGLFIGWGRVAPGLCPDCGYDLRATPGRCPECGRVPQGMGA